MKGLKCSSESFNQSTENKKPQLQTIRQMKRAGVYGIESFHNL